MSNAAIVRGSGPREGFPDYVVKGVRRNEIGIVSGEVTRHFKVGTVNQRIMGAWIDRFQAPNPGWGIPCINCEAEIRDAMCIVSYLYQGAEDSYTFNADEDVLYELDTTMSSERIEEHSEFEHLKNRYGWDDGEERFSEYLTGFGKGASGALSVSSGAKELERNPLAGTDSWFNFGAVFRKTYAARIVPGGIYEGIGTIITRPEGVESLNLPAATVQGRFWLRLAPRVSKRGNAVQIIESAMLGKRGGRKAAEIIYKRSSQL